jgi:hypothetical protein
MKFQLIPTRGLDGIYVLLSRNTKFIAKSEQIPEKLSPLGYTRYFLNVKI